MKKIILNLIFLFTVTLLSAQVDRSKMPEAGPAPKIELGETQSFTLENGLKVFVVTNDKLPKVAFSLLVDRDPLVEGDKAGYTQMAGELLSKGTKSMTKDEFNFATDFIGASFFTSSSSVFASSLKKHQSKLLEIMSDVVMNADFKEEELEKIRTQTISGLQTEKDDPDAIARNVKGILMYGKDHPYGEIMTEETAKNITIEDVKTYYETYFKPNISYLAVVGDITMDEAKPLIEKYFGDWKKGEVPTHEYTMPEQPQATRVAFVNKPGAVQSVISVFNTIDLKPGTDNVVKSTITNGILGGGFVSKLNLNLREAHSYTYGARSNISADKLVGNFSASAKVRNEVTDSALTETVKELMNMRNGNITEDELLTIKNYRTGTFAIGLENAQTKAQFAINIERYGMDKDYYSNYLKSVAAVTLDDVKKIAIDYINPYNGFILVVGNQEEVADKIKKFSITGEIEFYDAFGNVAEENPMRAAPSGVTAATVIDSYLNAIGGKEKLEKVKSVKIDMTVAMGPNELNAVSVHQQPDKYMTAIKMGTLTIQEQVYNGEKGRNTNQGVASEMTEDQLADMKFEANAFAELTYLSNNLPMTLKGIDKRNDEDVYVVEVEFPNDKKQTNFYSVKTGLKLSHEVLQAGGPGGSMLVEGLYSEYKEVKGIKYPHLIVQSFGPQKIEMKVTSVEIDGKIDKSIFKL